MEFKDHSLEIEAVSKNYISHDFPPWLLRLQELTQQMLQFLQELLERLLRNRASSGPADSHSLSTLLQYALYLAGIIAFVLICYLLLKRAAQAREETAEARRGAASIEKILDSQGYRKEAEKLALAADFRGACRALYLSLLQDMHEKSVAAFAPAKTNYEYRYLLAGFPQLQSSFMQLAEIIEQVWFGNKNAGMDDYTECLNLLASASQEVQSISANSEKEEFQESAA